MLLFSLWKYNRAHWLIFTAKWELFCGILLTTLKNKCIFSSDQFFSALTLTPVVSHPTVIFKSQVSCIGKNITCVLGSPIPVLGMKVKQEKNVFWLF